MKNLIFALLLLPLNSMADPVDSWEGDWTGVCQHQNEGRESRYAVSLKVGQKIRDERLWQLKYEGQSARNYTLVTKGEGRYELDENNGIILSKRWHEGRLITGFVAGNLIYASEYSMDENGGLVLSINGFSWGNPQAHGVNSLNPGVTILCKMIR